MTIPVAFLRRLHLISMAAWVVLLVPTLLWWRESIIWIIVMSWYANFVGHFASWQGARSEDSS